MTDPTTLHIRFGQQANARVPRVWPCMMIDRSAEQQRVVVDTISGAWAANMVDYGLEIEARTWGLVLVPLAEGGRADLWGGKPWRRIMT